MILTCVPRCSGLGWPTHRPAATPPIGSVSLWTEPKSAFPPVDRTGGARMGKETRQHDAPRGTPAALVAEVNRLGAELDALRTELERSQKLAMLGTVAAMVAHEVNNLMTPVVTYAQMAQANPGDAALMDKALSRAIAGAQQASRIATSILALAKLRADDRRQCDVSEAVADAIACVPRGTLRAIQVETELQPSLHAAISTGSLQQVVLNLVLNAVKAVGAKPGRIAVRGRYEGSGAVVIEVEDDGPGVAAEMSAKVFEP